MESILYQSKGRTSVLPFFILILLKSINNKKIDMNEYLHVICVMVI